MRYAITIGVFCAVLAGCSHKSEVVQSTPGVPAATRVYYIAAEEMLWDYAPQGYNAFMGMPFDGTDSVYAVNSPSGATPRIGRQNWKARYVAYTDSTFTTKATIPPEWQHLGILGPVIRANVGDSVLIYFKNKTSIDASIHVHGLEYAKSSEGALDSSDAPGSDIAPGGSYVYKYYARDGSAPTSAADQPSSTVWFYHSHVNMNESDMYAGLIGPIIVTRQGMGDANAKPKDVDREFVTLFMIWDENNSPYLEKSTQQFCPGFTNPNPDDFTESNKKHSINGMFMGNLPGLTMKQNERVRWYVLDMGNEDDVHTPHWHGNTVVSNGVTTDVLELLPADMQVADMYPDNPGTWAFHCHVSDHMTAGMTAYYTVQ